VLYLVLLLFILVCGGLVGLTVLNVNTQVHFVVLNWKSPDLPVGFWLIIAFFLGALLLYLVSVASAFHDRREMKRLNKRIAELEQRESLEAALQSDDAVPPGRPTGPLMPMPGISSSGDLPTQKFRP